MTMLSPLYNLVKQSGHFASNNHETIANYSMSKIHSKISVHENALITASKFTNWTYHFRGSVRTDSSITTYSFNRQLLRKSDRSLST